MLDIIEQLKKIGFEISDIYDLVNSKKKYTTAIPYLIKFLNYKCDDERLEEGVIRSLAVEDAKGLAAPALIKKYNETNNDKILLKWAIGNSIFETITKENLEDILPLVIDKRNGISRQMLVSSLGKFKENRVEEVLISLLKDKDVLVQAIEALGKIQSLKSKDLITPFLVSKNKLIRNEAQKALKKIAR